MLEDRPIVQRSLIGLGAFSFVFTAAMAGTAFMISGGFGLGGEHQPQRQSLSRYAAAAEPAWNNWTQSAYAGIPAHVTPSTTQAPAPTAEEPAAPPNYLDESTYLEGDAPVRGDERTPARTEAEILRHVERELAAYQDEIAERNTSAYSAPPMPEDDIVAAKEAAAAREGYGPY